MISASNGYLSKRWDPLPGYTQPNGPFDGAINAPKNCEGTDTFIRSQTFPISASSSYKPENCQKACNDQADYERKHPVAGKALRTCQFFNSYLLMKNGVAQSQVCSMVRAHYLIPPRSLTPDLLTRLPLPVHPGLGLLACHQLRPEARQ